jgi:hypothetical protein
MDGWRGTLKLVARSVIAVKLTLSGRPDSNRGPPAPKAGALTKLRYAPLHHSDTSESLLLRISLIPENSYDTHVEEIVPTRCCVVCGGGEPWRMNG